VLVNIRQRCDIPLVLFPGNSFQLSYRADAILFLSLISGRNPELLIGNHVIAAPYLKISPLEVMSCGYMLIDGGRATTVSYMSNTTPIPAEKSDIALCTAVAGEMLGLKLMFMDAGSGALQPVPLELIETVGSAIEVPLIVGGGIRDAQHAYEAARAGADLIVVGNAIEQSPDFIGEVAAAVHKASRSVHEVLTDL
jgi:geranylgeranylglyceryl phosphate synthase family protein